VPETQQPFLHRRWVRRVLPAGVAAVLVIAGTLVTRANASASPLDTYRTTTVTTGSVEQRLNLTGSVQRVSQVTESFPAAGTVTSVPVSVGDTVTVGQALATIDPAPLRSAVTAAQAALARAKATLESDQTTSASATSGSGASTGTSGTGSSSSTGNAGSSGVATTPAAASTTSPRVTVPSRRSGGGQGQSLSQVQKRVASAQKAITTDLGRATTALAQCVPFFPSGSSPSRPSASAAPPAPRTTAAPTTPPATSSPPATGPTPSSTSPATTAPSPAQITACIGALRTAPTQQQIQRDQQALTRSQADLMTAVTLAITTVSSASASSTAGSADAAGQSSTSRSSASGSSASGLSASGSATSRSSGSTSTGGSAQSGASRVVSDQAALTQAGAALDGAQADLVSATLKSSIAGTVGSVTFVRGTSSAGLSVVVVGAGAAEVTVNVPLASIASVRVGQTASVTPQGATGSVAGAVTSISLLPSTSASATPSAAGRATTQGTGNAQSSSTSTSPAYPVVVLVPDPLPALASGSRAEVSLLTGTANHVVTVPNSALTPLGRGQALALTLKNGAVTRALVTTGYTGTLATQVTSGLTAGQQVVLADLSTALPTNTTSSRRFGVGGSTGSGLGGASLGGGGLGGAGLGGGGPGFAPRG